RPVRQEHVDRQVADACVLRAQHGREVRELRHPSVLSSRRNGSTRSGTGTTWFTVHRYEGPTSQYSSIGEVMLPPVCFWPGYLELNRRRLASSAARLASSCVGPSVSTRIATSCPATGVGSSGPMTASRPKTLIAIRTPLVLTRSRTWSRIGSRCAIMRGSRQ